MQTAVHCAAVVLLAAEILPQGLFLVAGDVHRVAHQLVHALALGGGDGHHRHPQHLLHAVYVHRAAVAGHLVHHVQGDDHGQPHLQQLHAQVEVAFDVGGVHNVDDGLGLLFQHKVPGYQLFAGIGGHGIDAGQIRDAGLGIASDHAVFPVHGDAGEIAHMLVGAGELVEERGLAGILVAYQGKTQHRVLRQGIAGALGVEFALLAKARVEGFPGELQRGRRADRLFDPLRLDLFRVLQTQGQLITVDAQFHGVSHGGQLHHRELRPGDHAHIQKMLPQRALAAYGQHPGALPGLAVFNGHNDLPQTASVFFCDTCQLR